MRFPWPRVLVLLAVSVAAAAEYLGDSPAVLLSTYAHLMPGDHDRARSVVEAAFSLSCVTGVSRADDLGAVQVR